MENGGGIKWELKKIPRIFSFLSLYFYLSRFLSPSHFNIIISASDSGVSIRGWTAIPMWECGIEADRMTTLPQRCLNARSFSVNSLSILSRVEKVLILHNNLPDHNIQKDIWRFRSDVNGRNVECFLLWRVHKCSLTCFSFIISLKLPHIMKMLLLISLSVLPIKWRFSFQRNFYLASSPFTAVINRGLFLMRPQKKIISRVLFWLFFCLRMNLYLNFFYENRRSWRELWVKMRFKKKDEAFVFPQSHVSVHDLLIWFFILFSRDETTLRELSFYPFV